MRSRAIIVVQEQNETSHLGQVLQLTSQTPLEGHQHPLSGDGLPSVQNTAAPRARVSPLVTIAESRVPPADRELPPTVICQPEPEDKLTALTFAPEEEPQ